MVSRRDFLKTLASAAIVSSTGGKIIASVSGRGRNCVIVGAGLAGLSAGYRLIKSGWNVTIIEARQRIGGRVFSYRFPQNANLVCELGAEWIGESHQRIQELCREFSLELKTHRFDDYLLRDGRVYRPGEWGFSEKAKKAFEKLVADYPKMTLRQKARLDRIDWWRKLSGIGFSTDDLLLRDLMDSTDFGESIRHVSAFAALAEYAESCPHNEMDFKIAGGNQRLTEEFAARIGMQSFRPGERVEEITQRRTEVFIKTDKQNYKADACIVTAPVASVRKIKFTPPLTARKRAALEELTYSRIVKNAVLFEERFWPADDFSLVSDTSSHYYFHSTQNQPDKQGILCSYAIGEKADLLASQSDRRRMSAITHDLRDFEKRAGELSLSIASYAWQRDEFTEGAYALYRPGQWFSLRPILQEPHGKVLFAGEHLADWQGFMEGAIETGEAAADALIK
jgi:monoamine oxidase